MTITEEINHFIENEGKGDVRDALNVALARLDSIRKQYALAMAQLKRERERVEYWKEIADELKDNLNNIPTPKGW
jgi:dTDP-4-amino-4,6-dideoxygalactose transaminase